MSEGVWVSNSGSSVNVSLDTLQNLPYKDALISNVITKIKQKRIVKIEGDTLGRLFEDLIKEEEKKELGQFYTPQEIVDYMINFLDIKNDSKVLDPTCGCGVFLVTTYNHIKAKNKKALENIYGVDLNESATKIARINLWLRDKRDSKTLQILERNIKIGNSLVSDRTIDARYFDWNVEFNDILSDSGFDYILGNPPYVTLKDGKDFDGSDTLFSKVVNGNTNSASLILAKSFDLLKDEGIIAFVLPKTLLRVNSYSKLRDFILDNSKIIHIYDLGTSFDGVRGEQILLFLQKTKDKSSIEKNKILIKVYENKRSSLENQKEFYISQNLFKKNNTFLMFEDIKYYELIEKIADKGVPLSSISNIFRGLTIGKSIQRNNKKGECSLPMIKGKNISKFHISINTFVDNSELINSAKRQNFKYHKIILQNIFSCESGIISAVDIDGILNSETVTNIVVSENLLYYIQALINTKLMNFYLMYAIYNKSRLTMHTDSVYLGKLPVIIPSKNQLLKINALAQNTGKLSDKKIALREMDKLIYDIYSIDKKEQQLINDSLQKIMSKKSAW